ncbi:hypothetical protein ACKWTF_016138 [Chironomus riparius]
MSNRNTRLPYNERAFSPQRMMSSNSYSSSNRNQQIDPFDNSSSRYQQAFYQLQSDQGRDIDNSNNQQNQNDFDSGWFRNETESRRNDQVNSQNTRASYLGYDSNSNQNFTNSSLSTQLSNIIGNVTSINAAQDLMPFNSDARFQSSNLRPSDGLDRRTDLRSDLNYRSSDRQLDLSFRSSDGQLDSNYRSLDPQRSNYRSSDPQRSDYRSSDQQRSDFRSLDPQRSDHRSSDPQRSDYRSSDLKRSDYGSSDQQRSEYGSSNQPRSEYGSSSQQKSNVGSSSRNYNSVWESEQNAFDDRVLKRSERSRDEGRRDYNSRQDAGSFKSAPKVSSDSSKLKPRTSGREPEIRSIIEQKARVEKFPDIGEPKINPRFEDVFDLVKKEDNGTCVYSCKVCKIDCLPDKNVPTHLAGKKHRYFLKLFEDSLPGKTKFQKEKHLREISRNKKNYDHKPMFEVIIASIKQPLIALEYIVEVLDSKVKEPCYYCVLCEKRCDPRTIEKHLISQTHRISYLTKHFAPIIEQIQAFRRFNEDLEFRQKVLFIVCSRIEVKFGRSSAFVYEGHDFLDTKADICDNINLKKHVTIDDIPNAEEKLLEGIKLHDPKWESENAPKPPRESLEIPFSMKRKRKVPENVLEEFKSTVDYAKRTMEEKLREYEKDPDSHPKYKVEWELFWNKKIDDMSRRGEDSTTHSFHDEWCSFFVRRMRELHENEIKSKVDQIRRNLGLTMEDLGGKSDNPEPKRNRHDNQDKDRPLGERRGRYANNGDNEGSLDEDFRELAPRIPKDVLYKKEKKIFSKFLHEVGIDQNKRPKPQPILVERREPIDRTLPQRSPPRSNEPTTLITTCRLLTSLEQELGLLAQKVLDLLSKSIAFEREHSKPSDELLFENENLILIETVKEKIIGMQMAHLISQSRTKAVEQAVNEITKLIGQHEMMINIKKTLKEMGKDEAAPEEIEMLKIMFMKKNDKGSAEGNDEHIGRRQRRRAKQREREMEAKAKESFKK